jgi:predicted ATPase
LDLFLNHFHKGLFILDEPESALSPKNQITFLALIEKLVSSGKAQFIISTHSPFLMSIPNAQVLLIEKNIKEVSYKETEHFQLTKLFLDNPNRFHKNFK